MKAAAGALAAAVLLTVAALPAAADGTKIIKKFVTTHPHTTVIFVTPSYPRWVPGYWSYQWVPQVYTYYAWVPGHYDANGYWVESHYEPQTVQTGYYQPIWMSGYWLQ